MLLKNINPFIRLARHSVIGEDSPDAARLVRTRDNRLFYITEGRGRISIEESEYALNGGTLVFIPSGRRYRIDPAPLLKLFVINFDHTENFSSIRRSFHPFSSDFPGTLEEVVFDDTELLGAPIVISDAKRFESRLRLIVGEFPDKGEFHDEFLSATLKSVIIDIVRSFARMAKGQSEYTPLVREVVDYLKENYAPRIENEDISRRFHFTSVYINRVFKKEMGVSLRRYLIRLRVDIARELLESGDYSPTETALLVGFEDYPHFSKTFKAHTGESPTRYRKDRY